MNNSFYRGFEDLHRGSRHEIIRRLQVYLPFVIPVAQTNPSAECLDLGCGRGEWLQLMAEYGINAKGVDIDEAMLNAAKSQGLNVTLKDALDALKNQADNSITFVTAFHLVEHLLFSQVQELVQQAHRVLVPGGVLILETPNPDNLVVASCNFYLDPSHIKPIPSLLLSFTTNYAGFARTKLIGLQESSSLRFKANLQLEDVLAGASPDYAVLSQKVGTRDDTTRLDAPFERSYGVSTSELAQLYSHQQTQALSEVRLEINSVRSQLQNQVISMQAQLQQHEFQIQQHEFQIQHIYTSAVWRLFKPIQWCLGQYRRIQQEGLPARIRALLYKARIMKAKSQSEPELSGCDAGDLHQRDSKSSKVLLTDGVPTSTPGTTATVAHNSTHATHANPD
ncbi:MAG: class I SAM-dependent methyltransferase [Burkholderiaceae bacterium]